MGKFPKMVGFPNKPMGFPTKNDQHLGCEMGVPPFKETPMSWRHESPNPTTRPLDHTTTKNPHQERHHEKTPFLKEYQSTQAQQGHKLPIVAYQTNPQTQLFMAWMSN